MKIKPKLETIAQDSILKKSIMLLLLVAPAYILNFAFLVLSKRILVSADFGIFYTGLSIINILSGPATILNLFYAKRITENYSKFGRDAAIMEFKSYVGLIIKWGSLIALITACVMCAGGVYIGVESIVLVFVIILTSYCIYLAETVRAAFQGLKNFVTLGITTLGWMAIRFILGIIGLLTIGFVWSGITGVLMAALMTFFVGYFILNNDQKKVDRVYSTEPIKLKKLLYFCSSYGLFLLLMYLDVLSGYLVLNRNELGLYSAACVIGKSMILITNPIVQVYYPLIVEQNIGNGVKTQTVIKTLGLTLAMCCSILLIVAIFPDFIGAKILGAKEMKANLLILVTGSGIPLASLRIFILLQLSKGRDRHGFILLPVCIIQFIMLTYYGDSVTHFAWIFTISNLGLTIIYGFLCIRNIRALDVSSCSIGSQFKRI